jgi:5-methylcytosine-specific restriction enzyme A
MEGMTMRRMVRSDDYPTYTEVEDALLKLLLGSKRGMKPKDVYPVLADQFGLTSEQRIRRRSFKDEPAWHNRVQWARQKLMDRGLINRLPHGIWSLTERGHRGAANIGKPMDYLESSPDLL